MDERLLVLLRRLMLQDDDILEAPVTIPLPHLSDSTRPVWIEMFPLGDQLVLYEPFGRKLDRRRERGVGNLRGGQFIVEPTSGTVTAYIQPSVQFAGLAASADGQWFYGMESGALDWHGPVRLLKISTATGQISAERFLETSVWSMAVDRIPARLVPRGEAKVNSCQAEVTAQAGPIR